MKTEDVAIMILAIALFVVLTAYYFTLGELSNCQNEIYSKTRQCYEQQSQLNGAIHEVEYYKERYEVIVKMYRSSDERAN